MEAALQGRMTDIITACQQTKEQKIAWILVADADIAIGNSVNASNIQRYQIQLQADLSTRTISYHGFPDERATSTGLGPSRNKLT